MPERFACGSAALKDGRKALPEEGGTGWEKALLAMRGAFFVGADGAFAGCGGGRFGRDLRGRSSPVVALLRRRGRCPAGLSRAGRGGCGKGRWGRRPGGSSGGMALSGRLGRCVPAVFGAGGRPCCPWGGSPGAGFRGLRPPLGPRARRLIPTMGQSCCRCGRRGRVIRRCAGARCGSRAWREKGEPGSARRGAEPGRDQCFGAVGAAVSASAGTRR